MGLERSPPPKTHISMGLKQVLPILALAASSYGAALPEAENFDMDTVMDLVQEFIANPDPYMEAFGVRAKRHVEDLNRSGFKRSPSPSWAPRWASSTTTPPTATRVARRTSTSRTWPASCHRPRAGQSSCTPSSTEAQQTPTAFSPWRLTTTLDTRMALALRRVPSRL